MINSEFLQTILNPVVAIYQDHITQDSVVSLPYAVIIEMSSENYCADNKVYKELVPLQVILHQAKRNPELESSIKEILNSNCIPYDCNTTWDRDNLIYATTFDMNG